MIAVCINVDITNGSFALCTLVLNTINTIIVNQITSLQTITDKFKHFDPPSINVLQLQDTHTYVSKIRLCKYWFDMYQTELC